MSTSVGRNNCQNIGNDVGLVSKDWLLEGVQAHTAMRGVGMSGEGEAECGSTRALKNGGSKDGCSDGYDYPICLSGCSVCR